MKHLARLSSLLVLVGAGFFLSNCGSDGGGDEKSQQEIQFEKLKGTWTVSAVTLSPSGSTNWNDEFSGGQLTLSTGNDFSENGEFNYGMSVAGGVTTSPWPANGKWKFSTSNPGSNIIRLDSKIDSSLDDLTMQYTLSNSDKNLVVTFDLPDGVSFTIGGRIMSVEGAWSFTFTKP